MGTIGNATVLSPNPGYTPVAKEVLQYPLQVDKLISLIPTPYAQDYYFEKGNTQVRDHSGQAGEQGAVQRIERNKGRVVYNVEDRAFDTVVPRRTEQSAQQQGYSDIQEAVEDLTMLTRTRHEKLGSLVMSTDANYIAAGANQNLLVGVTDFVKWALPNTGDPIATIYTLLMRLAPFDPALAQCRIGIGTAAMEILAQHDKTLEAVKYVRGGGRVGPEDLKIILNKWVPVEEVFILQAQTEDYYGNPSQIWAADELFVSVTQKGEPKKNKSTAVACFRQEIEGADDIAVYTAPTITEGAHGGTYVKVAMSEVFKVINNRLFGRLKDAV